jgi:hypothetical protein
MARGNFNKEHKRNYCGQNCDVNIRNGTTNANVT